MSGVKVAIEWNGRPTKAWLPDPLAYRPLDLPIEVARATERAAAAVQRVGDRLPNGREAVARLLLRAEGIASSHVDGMHAPADRVAAAELDEAKVNEDAALVAANVALVNHALAHAHGTTRLTVDDLHHWHASLLRDHDVAPRVAGAFRTTQDWVGGHDPTDAEYVPPPADRVPELMDDLVAFANARDVDAITQAAVTHAQFETIHPYHDGNGRIGRLLVMWTLARRLHVLTPPPTSVLVARDAAGYVNGLRSFRTGELARWVDWFAQIVEASASETLAWTDHVAALMHEWRSRIAEVRADSAAHAILETLPAHPVLTPVAAARITYVSDTAARAALELLHERGIVEPYEAASAGRGRPRAWWIARELVDVGVVAQLEAGSD